MADSTVPSQRCVLYTPGHSIHWIQARLTWREPRPRTPVSIIAIDDGGLLLETPDGTKRFLNHGTRGISEFVEEVGNDGELVGYGVLQLSPRSNGATPMICIKLDEGEPLDRCRHSDEVPRLPRGASSEQIAKHLIEATDSFGGASIFRE